MNQDGKNLDMSISIHIEWKLFGFFYYRQRLRIPSIDNHHSSSGIFTSYKTNKPYNGPELSTYKSPSNLYKWWSFYTPNKRLQTAMAIQVNTWGMKLSPFIGTSGSPSMEPLPVTLYMRPLQVEIIYKYQVQSSFIIKAIESPGLTSHLRCETPSWIPRFRSTAIFLYQTAWTQVFTMSLAGVWISLWGNLLVQTLIKDASSKLKIVPNSFLYYSFWARNEPSVNSFSAMTFIHKINQDWRLLLLFSVITRGWLSSCNSHHMVVSCNFFLLMYLRKLTKSYISTLS